MSKEAKEAAGTIENPFTSAKESIVITPKVTAEQVYHYKGFENLKNLIGFVGARPLINEDGSLQFRKVLIPENSIIFRNSLGQVTKVMNYESAGTMYDIVAQSDFLPEHKNVVVPKVK